MCVQAQRMWKESPQRLLAVGDLTCDINGSVEFLTKSTEIEHPFFLYNPETEETHDKLDGDGVVMVRR